MRNAISIIAVVAGMATAAHAGDFSTSGVTYSTPDFDVTGGTRSVSTSQSALIRFPLVAGAEYTVSYQSTNSTGYALAVYDFVAPESASGDPFTHPYVGVGNSGLIATSYSSFVPSNSLTFTAATDGFGTIELSNYYAGATNATVTLVTDISAVPLPAGGALLLGGLAAFAGVRRMKKAKA